MALHSYDCCAFPPLQPQLDWNWDWDLQQLHTLLGDATFQASLAGVESPVSSEASSGYLLDAAVAHWSVDHCNKRQRTVATPPSRRPAGVSEDLQFLLEGIWDPAAAAAEGGYLAHDLETRFIPKMSCSPFVSEPQEDGADASGREEQEQRRGPSTQVSSAEQRREDAAAVVPPPPRSSAVLAAAPLQKATAGAPHHTAVRCDDRSLPVVDCYEPSRTAAASTTTPGTCPSATAGKEKTGTGVLYPFAVIKPLGLDDGCMTTLSDVNRRMLKRPARPVRHPVGAFACSPVTAHGLGLSGKAIVSLTKISTGGKGTITIIRTRG